MNLGKNARIVRATPTAISGTTQYGAGEVVSGLLTFAGAGAKKQGSTAWIFNASLVSSVVASTAVGDFELWLFNAAPTVAADNAAFSPTDAQMQTSFLGVIKFYNELALAVNTTYMADPDQLPFAMQCAGAEVTSIYGVLVARSTYTPTNGETFTVALHIDDNNS